ncbi:MAG: TonB-dependent receptor, partial [Bacteroidales bacterium]|nr:TonB-dependent receptor [Bacteroidales bacterium]
MKNLFITLAIFSLCAFSLTAQHQLSGIVRNEADGSPIPYVTAALLRSDSSAVTGIMTGADGKFTIQNVASGNYILQVSFIGYERAFRNVNVPAQSVLGDITLSESANRLAEVVVSADRPLVVARTDRYVVNVSGNIQSAGRNATNILQNTPGVLVNQQGDISVLGNNVEVWIDGRPSQMSGEQLQAFLSSMQGDEIDRIEVITNPSSRYDAAG